MTAAAHDPERSFARELQLALRVPYPLVFVSTPDETATLELLRHLAADLDKPLLDWSCLHTEPFPEALHDLLQQPRPTILALVEPGPELEVATNLRYLQELAPHLTAGTHTAVIIAADAPLPTALARHATTLVAPLPGRAPLASILAQVLPPDRVPLLPRERLVAAALGLTRDEARRAFTRARLAWQDAHQPVVFDWERRVLDEKKRALSADDVAEYVDVDDDLAEIGGLDDLKDWLETRKAAFGTEARAFGLPAPRGLLLVGVQGCGKSLTAKAVARHWALPLLRLDLGAIFGGRLAPDAALRRALAVADAIAPCVLWTDEIEKGFAPDQTGTTTRVLGTLLTWLQEKRSEVFFVATANEVTELPPELLRKGRFDEMFFVDLPDERARAHILAIHLAKRDRDPARFDLAALAAATHGFSGAELEQVVVAALYEAFAEARELSDQDLAHAAELIVPLYATREDAIKALREWASSRARFAARDQRLVDFFEPS